MPQPDDTGLLRGSAQPAKGWVILADLDQVRRAVRFREGCVKATLDYYRRVDLQPIATYARAAFDAVELRIRADERQRLREALADLLEPSQFPEEVTHHEECDRGHTGCLAAKVREAIDGEVSGSVG